MKTDTKTQVGTFLLVIGLYLLVPTWLKYPLDLFLTFIHESGHALAALVSGGEVVKFVVDPNMAGVTFTRGGWRFLVLSGGYLGVTLAGAVLLRLNTMPEIRRYILEATAVFVAGLTLKFAGTAFTLALGLGMAAVLGLIGRFTNDHIEYVVVNFLGVYVGMGALKEFPTLWALHGGARRITVGAGVTDAEALANATGLPANAWVVLWLVISLVVLGRELRRGAGL